jgi:hypothetical protein
LFYGTVVLYNGPHLLFPFVLVTSGEELWFFLAEMVRAVAGIEEVIGWDFHGHTDYLD